MIVVSAHHKELNVVDTILLYAVSFSKATVPPKITEAIKRVHAKKLRSRSPCLDIYERKIGKLADKRFQAKMKTPNNQKCSGGSRSVSEAQLPKSKMTQGKPLPFKFNEKPKNSLYLESKFAKPKSEASINKNSLVSVRLTSNDTTSESQLIPSPKTPKHPKDVLRKSLIKLKSAQWNEAVSALRDIIQISRFNPQLLLRSMDIIYKGIIVLLKSLRTTAARTACQAANELFMNMPPYEGSEFVNLVHELLQKTADGNKYLREDALEALDSMVIHVPPAKSIKILLHKRIAGYNLSVRATASKLLACVIGDSDADMSASLSEDTKTRLVLAALRFLQDDCHDIKLYGMRLVTTLMRHKQFETIFREKAKISTEMLNRNN